MTPHRTVNACLILIGNELLSGRTQDKNLAYIAKELNELGIQLARAHVIPDESEIIVEYINKCRKDYDYVFTTGGIGPTHDDITSECVAEAFGVPMVRDPDTIALMTKRVEERGEIMNEARLRMATFPQGSTLLPNSISAAPGYCMENVFVMAGVPRVMRTMFEEAKKHLTGGSKVNSRGLAIDLGEGTIADALEEIQNKYPELDIGSYPQMRQEVGFRVSVVIRGREDAQLDEAHTEIMQAMRDLGGNPKEENPNTAQASAEPSDA